MHEENITINKLFKHAEGQSSKMKNTTSVVKRLATWHDIKLILTFDGLYERDK